MYPRTFFPANFFAPFYFEQGGAEPAAALTPVPWSPTTYADAAWTRTSYANATWTPTSYPDATWSP